MQRILRLTPSPTNLPEQCDSTRTFGISSSQHCRCLLFQCHQLSKWARFPLLHHHVSYFKSYVVVLEWPELFISNGHVCFPINYSCLSSAEDSRKGIHLIYLGLCWLCSPSSNSNTQEVPISVTSPVTGEAEFSLWERERKTCVRQRQNEHLDASG